MGAGPADAGPALRRAREQRVLIGLQPYAKKLHHLRCRCAASPLGITCPQWPSRKPSCGRYRCSSLVPFSVGTVDAPALLCNSLTAKRKTRLCVRRNGCHGADRTEPQPSVPPAPRPKIGDLCEPNAGDGGPFPPWSRPVF